ncbi:MAG TPA: right-handed parallel beta-helix repeat-containing protein, partial [Tepidisphaeraceae bacterium]|nr:right-handed parallel beta-helix repeat-containing protein [Tepidisphaeraceae bacterium]
DPWADKLAPHTTGILLNGTDITLMNSRIDFSSGDGVFVGGSGNTVENCAITNTDYSGFDEAGITTMGANETITGNTVERTGRSGIVIRYSPATSVTHNFLTGIGLLTTDFGGIYTFDTDGGGAEIAYNIVEGYHSAGFGSSGIFLDDGSSNYVVDHNLAYDVDYGMKMNPPVPSNMVFNNTLSGSQWSLLGNMPDGWDGTQLVNNIFLGPTSIGNNVLSSNNLFDLPMSQFVNPASGDYRLAPGAVAIGDGEFLPPYLVTAPGRAPDVGAYEFGTTPFAAGAMI